MEASRSGARPNPAAHRAWGRARRGRIERHVEVIRWDSEIGIIWVSPSTRLSFGGSAIDWQKRRHCHVWLRGRAVLPRRRAVGEHVGGRPLASQQPDALPGVDAGRLEVRALPRSRQLGRGVVVARELVLAPVPAVEEGVAERASAVLRRPVQALADVEDTAVRRVGAGGRQQALPGGRRGGRLRAGEERRPDPSAGRTGGEHRGEPAAPCRSRPPPARAAARRRAPPAAGAACRPRRARDRRPRRHARPGRRRPPARPRAPRPGCRPAWRRSLRRPAAVRSTARTARSSPTRGPGPAPPRPRRARRPAPAPRPSARRRTGRPPARRRTARAPSPGSTSGPGRASRAHRPPSRRPPAGRCSRLPWARRPPAPAPRTAPSTRSARCSSSSAAEDAFQLAAPDDVVMHPKLGPTDAPNVRVRCQSLRTRKKVGHTYACVTSDFAHVRACVPLR